MIVSIHQPNFLPWIGFFNKIMRSDVYVVFDDVQFPRGKDFAYRNRIKTLKGEAWLSAPVANKSDLVLWKDAFFTNTLDWKTKHLHQIRSSYQNAKYFNEVMPFLEQCYNYDSNRVVDFNMNFIKKILVTYNWMGTIVYSSDMAVQDKGLGKIMGILDNLNTTEYLTGEGAGSQRYINEAVFAEQRIKLTYQHYTPVEYRQLYSPFLPSMSIIDLLFNEGFNSKHFII
jgi:hypothetical protein